MKNKTNDTHSLSHTSWKFQYHKLRQFGGLIFLPLQEKHRDFPAIWLDYVWLPSQNPPGVAGFSASFFEGKRNGGLDLLKTAGKHNDSKTGTLKILPYRPFSFPI